MAERSTTSLPLTWVATFVVVACADPSVTPRTPEGDARIDSAARDGGPSFDAALDAADANSPDPDGGQDVPASLDAGAPDGRGVDGGEPTGFDVSTNPSCEEAHANILRLYQAFLGRRPDVSGANYWIDQYQSGVSVLAIGALFGESAEFHAAYDGLDNAAFVTRVYENVLGRAPDAEGRAYWLGELDAGRLTRTGLIMAIAASSELRTRLPYAPSPFCQFVSAHTAGYARAQIAPHTVYARSSDGNINVAYVDTAAGGALRVPASEATSSTCADRTIPRVRLRPPGHHGGTVAINGNWFGCYLPRYFAGYSISSGAVLGEAVDGRRGYIGSNAAGALQIGHYEDTAFAVPDGLHNAVSGVTLVVGGAPWPGTTTASGDPTFTNRHPRTAAGKRGSYLVLVTVDGRTVGPGMTGTEAANLMIGLGAERAIMLDGGGSSAMYITGRGIVNEPSDGSTRSVANQLVLDSASAWVR